MLSIHLYPYLCDPKKRIHGKSCSNQEECKAERKKK